MFNYIYKKTDGLPFYIQHVFAYFHENGMSYITEDVVHEAIDYLVNDAKDEGFFRHYTDRIKTYYDKSLAELSFLILDKACKNTDYWEEEDIINIVNTNRESGVANEIIIETLNLLREDHYLIRKVIHEKRQYKFKYSILQNWWKTNRG